MVTRSVNPPPGHKVTIAGIAEMTGYSRSTVAHVLNGRGEQLRISPKTSQKILDAAHKTQYIASPLARGLRGERTNAIGVLWTLGSSRAFGSESTLRPLTEVIARLNCVAYMFDHGALAKGPLEILKNLQLRGADGVVIRLDVPEVLDIPGVSDLIRTFPLRVLVMPEAIDFDADIIVYNRKAAIQVAMEELLRSGRRRFLFVVDNLSPNRYKVRVMEEAVAAFGQGAVVDAVDIADEKQSNLSELFGHFDADPRFAEADAMLFSMDEYAATGIRWLERCGRRCPEDVAVVGFNNSEFTCVFAPPLASVDRVEAQLVKQIDELIQNRRDHPDSDCQRRRVEMRYVRRESAICNREAAL